MQNNIRQDNAKSNSFVYIDHNFEQALQTSSVCIHAHGFGLKSLCAFACKHNGTCSWSILFSILSFSILFSILSISSSVGPLFFGGGADLKAWTCLHQIGTYPYNKDIHTINERSINEYSIRFCIWFLEMITRALNWAVSKVPAQLYFFCMTVVKETCEFFHWKKRGKNHL